MHPVQQTWLRGAFRLIQSTAHQDVEHCAVKNVCKIVMKKIHGTVRSKKVNLIAREQLTFSRLASNKGK